MSEMYPYTNFHDLNMDWIIKICKDFLDQYTTIQETITSGLSDITNTKDDAVGELEHLQQEITAALNGWYDQHSADIATELEDALADLNSWYQTHTGYLDAELAANIAAFSAAADAKKAETMADIPSGYTQISGEVTRNSRKVEAISPNLFNVNSIDLQTTQYLKSTDWSSSGGNARLGASHPIFVKAGSTYKTRAYAIFGVNNKWIAYVNYPTSMAVVTMTQGTVDPETLIMTWTAPDDGFIVTNIDMNYKNSHMFCNTIYYPEYYIPYNSINGRVLTYKPNDFDTSGYKEILESSPNLFNKNDTANIQLGMYFGANGYVQNTNIEFATTHAIYVTAGHTYKCRAYSTLYGTNGRMFAYVNNATDKQIVSVSQTGTVDDDDFVTWTAPSNGYIVKDILATDIDSFMFCEAAEYPDTYHAYRQEYLTSTINPNASNNLLYDKTVIMDGDSIFKAASDRPAYKNGFWGRLVFDKHVTGENYAVSGGTICYTGDETRYCIARNMPTIHEDHPSPDYVILEGGTNDADIIGRFIDGTPPLHFGTWTETDFGGNYDDTTFCGAVESLFYQALTYFPNSKIGFVIPMEMGITAASVTNRRRYFDEIRKIARKWHIPVLDLWEEMPADARLSAYYDPESGTSGNIQQKHFYADGQHPLSFGYDKMQHRFESWMETL